MSSSNKKLSNSHLSLVKTQGSATPQVQVFSFEKLNDSQSLLLNDYLEVAGLSGSCSGALIAAEGWDIRPLLLQENKLTITRFFDPSLAEDPRFAMALRSYFRRVEALRPAGFHYFGQSDHYFWIVREFTRSTFLDEIRKLEKLSFAEKKQICTGLAEALYNFHSAGVIHGNVCLSNLAWKNGKAVFLDFGFSRFSSHKEAISTLAPELKSGLAATSATDVYGLGRVFEHLFGEVKSLSLYELISAMTQQEPALRPSLTDVINFFATDSRLQSESSDDLLNPLVKQPETAAPSPAEQSKFQNISPQHFFAFALVLFFAFSFYYGFVQSADEKSESYNNYETMSFEELWSSSQPSMMQVVAREAIANNDRSAQALIIKEVFEGKRPTNVNTELIKLVFNPSWEAGLSDADRRIALSLATAGLFNKNLPPIPSLSEASPIVLLGITGSLQVETSVRDLSLIPASKLTSLPPPFAAAFEEFNRVKETSLDDISVKALSHIVLGDYSEANLNRFFSDAKKDVDLFRYTRVLIPVMAQYPELANQLHAFLLIRSKVFAQVFRWFDDEAFAEWKNIGKDVRISIVAGIFPQTPLSFEQYADLLKYPNSRIAKEASAMLNRKFYSGKRTALINFLASESNKLTRYQTISLLASLPLKDKAATDFYTKWFNSNPEHTSILEVLILRADEAKNDAFSFAAAQYLTDKNWQTSHTKLKKLVLHPEPLARALAYSKLDKNKPKDLELLKTMSIAEPSPRLREQLQRIIAP